MAPRNVQQAVRLKLSCAHGVLTPLILSHFSVAPSVRRMLLHRSSSCQQPAYNASYAEVLELYGPHVIGMAKKAATNKRTRRVAYDIARIVLQVGHDGNLTFTSSSSSPPIISAMRVVLLYCCFLSLLASVFAVAFLCPLLIEPIRINLARIASMAIGSLLAFPCLRLLPAAKKS